MICANYNTSLNEIVWPRLIERRYFKFFVPPARPGFGKIRCKASTEGCLFCNNENYWKTGKRYGENISVAILPEVDFSLGSQVKIS